MCNLYSMGRSQAEVARAAQAMVDQTGNLPPLPGIFPDHPAPIVRQNAAGDRKLAMACYGKVAV
jgi:putative SOS response-associated peptidase YedK